MGTLQYLPACKVSWGANHVGFLCLQCGVCVMESALWDQRGGRKEGGAPCGASFSSYRETRETVHLSHAKWGGAKGEVSSQLRSWKIEQGHVIKIGPQFPHYRGSAKSLHHNFIFQRRGTTHLACDTECQLLYHWKSGTCQNMLWQVQVCSVVFSKCGPPGRPPLEGHSQGGG